VQFCPDCGTGLPDPQPHFCPDCGAHLADDAASSADEAERTESEPESVDGQGTRAKRFPGWVWIGVAALTLILAGVGLFVWSAAGSAQREARARAAQASAKAASALLTTMPDVRGMTALQATGQMKSAGLAVGKVDYDAAVRGAPGAVVSQDPGAGTRVRKGAIVVLTVAGKQPVAVPKFLGLDRGGAQAAAAVVGLNVVVIETSSKAKVGTVLSQQPAPGSSVPPGSSVNINVAKGSSSSASTSDGTHAPAKGSSERTAIMDACRIYFSYNGKFIVNELKVRGTRAFANLTPVDNPAYGSTGVYLLKNGSGWVVSTDSRTAAGQGTFVSEGDWLANR